MKITIWYFSGSGQCADLAKKLTKKLSTMHEIELVDITPFKTRATINKTVETDQLIVIAPVYSNDAPDPLLDFCNSLHADNVPTQVFILWGKCHKGAALYHVAEALKKNGFLINGAGEICSEHTLMLEHFPQDTNQACVDRAEQYIQSRLMQRKIGPLQINKTSPIDRFMSSLPHGTVARAASDITLNEEKCTHCGLCAGKCPVNAIKSDMTIDESKCLRCLKCVSTCPMKAREFIAKKITGKALAHHRKENERETDVFYQ